MPLTTAHGEFIESTLAHLLDFSTDPQQFNAELIELKNALDKNISPNQTNGFYQLRQCLFDPVNFLQALEDQQPSPITQGEVKSFIIDLINNKLQEKAKELNLKLTKESWDKDNLIEATRSANDNKRFISNRVVFDTGPHPWALPELSDVIYSRKFRINETINDYEELVYAAAVDVVVTLSSYAVSAYIPLDQFAADFETDEEETLFLDELKEDAEFEAEEFAALAVKKYWADKFPYEQADLFAYLPKQIITHQFYFDLVEQNKLDYHALINLAPRQVQTLINPAIIDLIKHHVCDLATAIFLTDAALRIVTHPIYHALLKSTKIHISHLVNISDLRSQFLICPPIANLIAQDKLTLLQAKRLPLELKEVLTNSLFTAYFSKPNVNWKAVSKLTDADCEFLKDNTVAKLIVNELVDITQLAIVTDDVLDALENKVIYDLVENKYIAIDELNTCAVDLASLLMESPQIIDWIKCGAIQLKDIQELSVMELYSLYYARRLYSICNDRPYIIANKEDNIDAYIKNMPTAALAAEIEINDFNEYILENLLMMFKADIQTKLAASHNNSVRQYQKFSEIISKAEHNTISWKDTLAALIRCADNVVRDLARSKYLDNNQRMLAFESDSLFTQPKRQKVESNTLANDLASLCKKIIKLSDINKMDLKTHYAPTYP